MKIIQAGKYDNGNLAYWVDYEGTVDGYFPNEVVSVNLGKVPEAVPNAWFFDVNNHQEEYEILLASGAIRFTGLQRQSGFVSYPLVVRAEDDADVGKAVNARLDRLADEVQAEGARLT